jgi:hypothetical protein
MADPQVVDITPGRLLPSLRDTHSLVYDRATQTAILFGGRTLSTLLIFALCPGQQQVSSLGYAPLPKPGQGRPAAGREHPWPRQRTGAVPRGPRELAVPGHRS